MQSCNITIQSFVQNVITTRKQSLRRLCFHRCLFVHRREVCVADSPPGQTPYPLDQADTPQAVTPLGRHPLLGRHSPPCSACWDTVNNPVVRIPLECILVYYIFTTLLTSCIFLRVILYQWRKYLEYIFQGRSMTWKIVCKIFTIRMLDSTSK